MQKSLADFQLPSPWDGYLAQIESLTGQFWERKRHRSYLRLQDSMVWRTLRAWLWTITDTMLNEKLTAFETFLLHASAYLHEIGWQAQEAPALSIAERYVLSGRMLIASARAPQETDDFGISGLDPLTVEMLARICAAVPLQDLSTLSADPEPGGYQEVVRLRYVLALFQLGNLLLVHHRLNETIAHHVSSREDTDLFDVRLMLEPYLSLIDVRKERLVIHVRVHPQDAPFAGQIEALFEEPLKVWWHENWQWLWHDFHFWLSFQPSSMSLQMQEMVSPLGLKYAALVPFLRNFQAKERELPLTKSEGALAVQPVTSEIPAEHYVRNKVFIGYCEKDRKFLEELRTQLAFYERDGLVTIWDKTQIPVGSRWRVEVEQAIQTTKVAILLVSPDFLASEFIVKNELPPILSAAMQEKAVIISIIVRPCPFDDSELAQFQALNASQNPVAMLSPAKRGMIWQQVVKLVKDVLDI